MLTILEMMGIAILIITVILLPMYIVVEINMQNLIKAEKERQEML